ncbi:tetratricopeptide repeat protein [Hyalangium rubrum]
MPLAFRSFQARGGRPLRVAVVQAANMGAVEAIQALLPVIEAYEPSCVAMCGVCAGRRGKTNLGDVIAADRLFFHDTGKQLPNEVQQDITTYNLLNDWKVAIEQFEFAKRFRHESWWNQRPIPFEWQENWLLAKLHEGSSEPWRLPECDVLCPQWKEVVLSLRNSGRLEPKGPFALTTEGREHIEDVLMLNRGRLPDLSPGSTEYPFRVHVAPMGSGNKVIEDETYWNFISEHMRKMLGLDMEAAALGVLAHGWKSRRARGLEALVMKGVMDFSQHGRDDHFKEFAARASAECLLAFLREKLEVVVVPDVDDILVPGTEPLPEHPPPSALLVPRYEVVPFQEAGRARLLEDLDRWCNEGPAVAVRLIHAEGGVGKTRLGIQWTQRQSAAGWAAGFLPRDPPDDWFSRLWERGQSVAVVIDYSESQAWLSTALMRILRYQQQAETGVLRRMRFLLLARNCGDWWQALRQTDVALRNWLDDAPPHELLPLAILAEEREKLFLQAVEAFARVRGKTRISRPGVQLTDQRFARVLYLHMAALAFVDGLPIAADTLMDVILDHEERFWGANARELGDIYAAQQRSLARQMVAAATLRGGIAEAALASAVAKRLFDRTLSDREESQLQLLHRVYQRSKDSSYLPALEPDLLGESMVLRVAYQRIDENRVPIDWIDRVLRPDDDAYAVRIGLEVLGRASATNSQVIRPWIERMLLAAPLIQRAPLALAAASAVALRTAFSTLGEVLADRLEADGDLSVARALKMVGVPYPTVSLRRVAEWVSRTLLAAVPESEDPHVRVEQAELLCNQAIELIDLGQDQKAVDASNQAIQHLRGIVKSTPNVFVPLLARSLVNLSIGLNKLKRYEEAVTTATEAVQHFRHLAERNPNIFLSDLLTALNNLGGSLKQMGRSECLAVITEAVQLGRTLAKRSPETVLRDFAPSLFNLGLMLAELDRKQEAASIMSEAIEQYRKLAARNPDGFLPLLADACRQFGLMLGNARRQEEALSALTEAVQCYRPLAKQNSGEFLPLLADCLNGIGAMRSLMRNSDDAVSAWVDARQYYRALVQQDPAAFLPNFVMCLDALSQELYQLGRKEESVSTTLEAVQGYRTLAKLNHEVFLPKLATHLHNLGLDLSEQGRRSDALAAASEAVQIRRELVKRDSDAFLPDLALSLNSLGARMSEVGQRKEALAVTVEAVQYTRPLAKREPNKFLPDLAASVNNLGARLSELGRHEEALTALQEAIDTLWPFFERDPRAFMGEISTPLNSLVSIHRFLRRPFPPQLVKRLVIFQRLLSH